MSIHQVLFGTTGGATPPDYYRGTCVRPFLIVRASTYTQPLFTVLVLRKLDVPRLKLADEEALFFYSQIKAKVKEQLGLRGGSAAAVGGLTVREVL